MLIKPGILKAFVLRLCLPLSMGIMATAQTLPTPVIDGFVNAFDAGRAVLCPGGLITIVGQNFGANASNITIFVGGKKAYVASVGSVPGSFAPSHLTAQIPVDSPIGDTMLTLTVGGLSADPARITLVGYAPALLTSAGIVDDLYAPIPPGLIVFRTPAGQFTRPDGSPLGPMTAALPGDTVAISVVGLGPTNPPASTGVSTTASDTATMPAVTVGGLPAKVTSSQSLTGSAGIYRVTFVLPAGLRGSQPVILSIGGATSDPVTVPLFGITSVVNNASFGSVGKASPGGIATIFANGLGTKDQSTGFPATAFQGVSITLMDTRAIVPSDCLSGANRSTCTR